MAVKKEDKKWLFVNLGDDGEIDRGQDNNEEDDGYIMFGIYTEKEFLENCESTAKYARFDLTNMQRFKVESKIVTIN